MLTHEQLKDRLHRSVPNLEKVLLVLAALERPSQVGQIKELARTCGLRTIDKWNVSAILGRSRGLAINTTSGWEVSERGREYLIGQGLVELVLPKEGTNSAAIDEMLNKIGREASMPSSIDTPTRSAISNKVFLVHGRDSGTMHEVARFLERIGLDVTILHERPNRGRTLISKFEQESADISYAVVLMTPDDVRSRVRN